MSWRAFGRKISLVVAFALVSVCELTADDQPRRVNTKAAGLMTNLRPPAKLPSKVDDIKSYANSKDRISLKLVNARTLGKPLSVEQLNEIVAEELTGDDGKVKAAEAIPDDQFVRRIFLDVLGELPAPADVEEYAADSAPDKKSKLIDRLLASPQFGLNWARYWHDAISYRNTGGKNREFPFHLEEWLTDQFNKNIAWDKIVSAIVSAAGPAEEAPEGMFIAAHDAMPAELAGESARLFLGLQVSCAQCHNHPNDHWKRDQFHELAAFFGRVSLRRKPGSKGLGDFTILEKPRAPEYHKPNLKDPSDPGMVVNPVFLSGQPIPANLSDAARRKALAELMTSKRNPYFAKAFVNRVWAEFIGAGFTGAVDDLGDQQQVLLPKTFEALGKSFAASNFDVKRLMRTILASDAYGRRYHGGAESGDGKAEGWAVQPTRLSAPQIFDALNWVLGNLGEPRKGFRYAANGKGRRPASFSAMIEAAFGFDPSLDAATIEGAIPQALAIMNNATVHARLSAKRDGNILKKLLAANPKDEDALRALYLRALARRPTSDEIMKCATYIHEIGNREEGFEDVLWALINTTEFLHNH